MVSLTPEVATTRLRKSWLGLLTLALSLACLVASSICAFDLISLRRQTEPRYVRSWAVPHDQVELGALQQQSQCSLTSLI